MTTPTTGGARWPALTASETEFLAEQELIAILPHFHIKENAGVLNFVGVRPAGTSSPSASRD